MKTNASLMPWRDGGPDLSVEFEQVGPRTVWVKVNDLHLMIRNDGGTPQVHAFTAEATTPDVTLTVELVDSDEGPKVWAWNNQPADKESAE